MNRVRILLAVVLVALAAITVSATAQDAGKKTFTGIVTDTMCGAKHMMNDKSAAECTRICVKQGMQYGLLIGDKVYALQGDTAAIDKLAGERATVTGTVNGNNIKVDAIKPASANAS